VRTPTAELVAPDVIQLLADKKWREVRAALDHLEPADAADVIDTIEPEEDAAIAFRLLPREFAADVFSHLEPEKQERLIELLGAERATRLIEELDPDDRAAVLDELPEEVATPLLARLSPQDRRITQAILGYPEESVGRLMTPDYVKVRPEWTIARAFEHIRKYGHDAETILWVYVVDAENRLIDDLRIRTLLLADLDATIESVMDHEYVALHAADDREEAVRAMNRYDRTALPVIDSLGLLVGIVTFDDVADVAEEEFTEDVHKLGGLEALDEPYMATTLTSMIKKRGGWLALLFVMQVGTIGVISFFDDQLAKAVVLASFIPLVISCGGNTGSQAATILVRALSLGEVTVGDWWRVARRELATGFGLGLVLGVLGFITANVANAVGFVTTDYAALVGVTVGLAVIAIVTWATMVGSLLPIVLRSLKLDPATSSTPLVATLMDVSGLTIYFAVALTLLRGTVL